jgi:Ca-activated chloride channel family protein
VRAAIVHQLRSKLLIPVAASMLAIGAAAQEGPAPGDPGTGTLLATTGGTTITLPLAAMQVDLAVSGPLVHGIVTQEFINPTADPLEAVYVFPLPEGAAVDGLVLEVNGRRFTGEIRENEEARKTYERAKVEGKRAGLVEQHRANIFRTSVANIPPGAKVAIRLSYVDEAEWVDGTFLTTVPTTITPRYGPDPVPAGGAWATTIGFHASIDAGVALDDVSSPSHELDVAMVAAARSAEVRAPAASADRDLVLRWRPARSAGASAGAVVEERPDGRYALALVVPPDLDGPGRRGFPTQTVFVVDVSGSMEGASIEQARAALIASLDRLRPGDTFTLIKFDSSNEAFSETLLPAEGRSIAAAKSWVLSLRAGSGTEIAPALLHALDISERGDAGMLRRVVLITDGAVSNEDEVLNAVERKLGGTRLHVVGIGFAPNRWLMKELARAGRGTFESIGCLADVQSRTVALLERTERAVMTDVALEWDGAAPLDATPDPVPDLYSGQPLVVTARLDSARPAPKLRVWGRAPGGPVVLEVPLHDAPAGAGIGARWARHRVAALEEGLRHGADPALVRSDVVDLARRFSLVTSYTSFVVVEDVGAEAIEEEGDGGSELPSGGTDEPLLLAIGAALAATGGAIAASALRHRGSAA